MLIPQPLHAKAAAEFIGTGMFCAIGVGSMIALADAGPVGLLGVALAHGLAIAAVMTAFGHTSGAHVNPAVTIGMLALRKMRWGEGLTYIAAQVAGAATGTALVRMAWPVEAVKSSGGGLIAIAPGVTIGQALLMEALLTAILMFTLISVAIDRDGAWFRVAGLPVGFVVSACILAGGPVSGAAMNPARTFGPALVAWEWADQWVYWVGAGAGSACACLAYVAVFRPRYHDAPT